MQLSYNQTLATLRRNLWLMEKNQEWPDYLIEQITGKPQVQNRQEEEQK